ncbi:siderophore ABC transporter substrate-binding protein [uncultured Ornithinimicrobium sp.]|uniref:siderophore ABC transporter substrate-binding protein n=1 Tax=uncultured Ornithinimicrobium sp. TaxID=259307 RepID=UPI00259A70BB|nr:ABC transporter substrate-binding protein [uncultured Ornithinimicrobium sp.]
MSRHPRHAVGAAALALTLTACGSTDTPQAAGTAAEDQVSATGDPQAATVSITDAQDRTVEVPVDPGTVVVTDWSAVRTLTDLGVRADAVPAPVSGLPEDLATYEGADVPKVGDVFEPDYEAIEGMAPDVVIVGGRSGTPEVVAEFEKFTTVVDLSVRAEEPSEVIPQTRERVEQLGRIFAVEDEATALMDELDSQIAELGSQISASGDTAMVVQVSDGTVSAYGPGSRFGLVYEDFGYAPTEAPLQEGGGHGDEISQEFFVQYDPDVLFVLDRAKAIGDDEQTPALDVLNNGLANTTTAVQDGRVVEVDGFAWYLATSAPSSIQQMIDDVRASLPGGR